MPAPDCIFCRIAAKTIPAEIVFENERLVAFLDIAPIRPGHVQIVPKDHHATFDDLPPDLLAEIGALAQRIAKGLKAIYGVERVGFAFTGTDIAHAHGHVVPLVAKDDLTSRRYIAEEIVTYRNPPRPSADDVAATGERIRAALAEQTPRTS
ncbi:HIT family protein [Enterovirga rhinocerotis]|nr:HIT family protein [Enterovirga rhinocerotis]